MRTRILWLIEIKLGSKDKQVQIDETHWFRTPKHFLGLFNKLCNWLFIAVCKELSLFYCQLVRKRIRPALETIIFQIIRIGTIIELDEHKAHY